jgi:hypothetical protein
VEIPTAVNKYHNNYGMGGTRTAREIREYKDFAEEPDGIPTLICGKY